MTPRVRVKSIPGAYEGLCWWGVFVNGIETQSHCTPGWAKNAAAKLRRALSRRVVGWRIRFENGAYAGNNNVVRDVKNARIYPSLAEAIEDRTSWHKSALCVDDTERALWRSARIVRVVRGRKK